MTRHRSALISVLVAYLVVASAATGQVARSVGFEGLAVGSALDHTYDSLGLVIVGLRIDTLPRAHSGTRVAAALLAQPGVSQQVHVTFTFATAQASVSFFAGTEASPRAFVKGDAQALDSLGSTLVKQTQDSITKGVCATPFALRTSTPLIRRVELQFVVYNPAARSTAVRSQIAIDDLSFEGLPLPARIVHVPRLSGLTIARARTRLADSGLTLGKVGHQVVPGTDGTVYRQDPVAGARARVGDPVGIVLVAKPPPTKPVRVPNLVGRTLKEADSLLRPLALHLVPVLSAGASGETDRIGRQRPRPDSLAHRGDSVWAEVLPAPARSWWWWVAGVGATILAAVAAHLARDRPRLPRLKAALVPESLAWRDDTPPVHSPLRCEVQLRVLLGIADHEEGAQ